MSEEFWTIGLKKIRRNKRIKDNLWVLVTNPEDGTRYRLQKLNGVKGLRIAYKCPTFSSVSLLIQSFLASGTLTSKYEFYRLHFKNGNYYVENNTEGQTFVLN